MRRILVFAGVVLAFAFALTNFSAQAVDKSFDERFADAVPAQADNSGAYEFDKPHTFIGFRVKHMGLIEVPGFFRDFTGTVNYDANDVTKSTVIFTAKTTSVDTGVAPRDNHLRTKDFFDVAEYPDMTFKSTKVEKKGKNLLVTGDFTMRGVTKQISFPFQVAGFLNDDKGGTRMGVTAETTINRRDFGVNYGTNLPNGAPMLSDNVSVTLQIEANKVTK